MNNDIKQKQQEIIYLLLKHKDLVSYWMECSLNVEHFDHEFRPILRAIEDCYEKGVLLKRKSFENYLKRISAKDKRLTYEYTLDKCSIAETEKDNFPILIEQVLENYLKNEFTNIIKDSNNKFSREGVLPTIKEIADKLSNLAIDSKISKDIIYQDIRGFSKDRLDYITKVKTGEIQEPPRITCDIPEIDDTMQTGFAEGTLTLFCADVGSFKSTMMLNIGMNIWEKGYNVLYVPIEMAHKRCYNRALARKARVDSMKISDPKKLSDEELDRLNNAVEEWENEEAMLYLLEMPYTVTVESIIRQVEKRLDEFSPKLVVIDYIDNMDEEKSFERDDLKIAEMLKKLRMYGQKYGFAVVSGAQLGREALKRIRKAGSSKKEGVAIHSEDLRGAHSYSMYADNIYAQLANTAQPTELLDFFVVKAREGKKTFNNGKMKTTLQVYPQFSLILSQENFDGVSMGEGESLDDILQEMSSEYGDVLEGDFDDSDVLDSISDDNVNSELDATKEILDQDNEGLDW